MSEKLPPALREALDAPIWDADLSRMTPDVAPFERADRARAMAAALRWVHTQNNWRMCEEKFLCSTCEVIAALEQEAES